MYRNFTQKAKSKNSSLSKALGTFFEAPGVDLVQQLTLATRSGQVSKQQANSQPLESDTDLQRDDEPIKSLTQ